VITYDEARRDDGKRVLYETASGASPVAARLRDLAKSNPVTFAAIQAGIRMLESFGPDPGLNRFKQLRHAPGGVELWELRAAGRPAYRVLFARVPEEEAYVLLAAVPKDDMARAPGRYVSQAVEHFGDWFPRHSAHRGGRYD
jgi:hypothetical protein